MQEIDLRNIAFLRDETRLSVARVVQTSRSSLSDIRYSVGRRITQRDENFNFEPLTLRHPAPCCQIQHPCHWSGHGTDFAAIETQSVLNGHKQRRLTTMLGAQRINPPFFSLAIRTLTA